MASGYLDLMALWGSRGRRHRNLRRRDACHRGHVARKPNVHEVWGAAGLVVDEESVMLGEEVGGCVVQRPELEQLASAAVTAQESLPLSGEDLEPGPGTRSRRVPV